MKISQQRGMRRYTKRGKKSHILTFGTATVSPETLGRTPQYIKDQGDSSYCTAAARSAAGSYYFNRDMSFEYQTAKEGEVAGSPIYNGTDPNTASEASEEYGFLPTEQSPLSFAVNGWTEPAEWQEYPPALDGQAIMNDGIESYNVNPTYADIKNALIVGQTSNSPVIANGFWYTEWDLAEGSQTTEQGAVAVMPTSSPAARHSYLFIDFIQFNGTEYLLAQLSQSAEWGYGGCMLFSQEVVDFAFSSPVFNGVGCEQFMASNNAQNEEISVYERLLEVLGEIKSLLTGV